MENHVKTIDRHARIQEFFSKKKFFWINFRPFDFCMRNLFGAKPPVDADYRLQVHFWRTNEKSKVYCNKYVRKCMQCDASTVYFTLVELISNSNLKSILKSSQIL